MNTVRTYRDLKVWNDGVDLAVEMYDTTDQFPKSEQFGLTSQLRRASVSVPSNIAEGQQRHATQDYIRFCRIALGSTGEIDTQLEISRRRKYLAEDAHQSLSRKLLEVRRMLHGLIGSLQQRSGNDKAGEGEAAYGTWMEDSGDGRVVGSSLNPES